MTSKEQKAIANWVAAVAEPTRIALIQALATGQKVVNELAKIVKTEVVNVSHHLGIMKSAGVVTAERDGRFMIYSLVGAKATPTTIELTHESGTKIVLPL